MQPARIRISAAAEFAADETAYHKLAEEICRFWNRCFVEPETGRTRTMVLENTIP